MVAVPAVTPVTIPLPTPTVATDAVVLFHVPPLNASDNGVVPPEAQVESVPLMGGGNVLIVTVVVAGAQPVDKV
jgi:hypothetical protein